jgi:cytosine/adenosine deaminase-related metal-dependent hydrolase
VLDLGEPERAQAALALASRPTRRGALRHPGISAHSPYTVSPELLATVARISRRRRWPVCIHWAETEEETRYLETGLGPFRGLLPESARAGERPRTGLGRIEAAGLLGPSLTLVHGNHPSRGDLDRVARSGAALVHCPGTHSFFGREPFPIRRWLDAGVPVALGTDGLSSNDDLDMRREMALVRREHPALAPGIVFDLATRAGARALGLAGNIGEIRSGSFADLCAHRVQPGSARDRRTLLEALTSGAGAVSGVWVAGRPVAVPLENPAGTSESRGSDAE